MRIYFLLVEATTTRQTKVANHKGKTPANGLARDSETLKQLGNKIDKFKERNNKAD